MCPVRNLCGSLSTRDISVCRKPPRVRDGVSNPDRPEAQRPCRQGHAAGRGVSPPRRSRAESGVRTARRWGPRRLRSAQRTRLSPVSSYILGWNWGKDRCPIRTGHGPANIIALRRYAIGATGATGAIKAKSGDTVSATSQRLARNVRLVFDYMSMTENSRCRPRGRAAAAGSNGFRRSQGMWRP
jgi:hypothetical protein